MLAEAYQSPLFQSFNGSVMLQPFVGPLTIDYLELFGSAVVFSLERQMLCSVKLSWNDTCKILQDSSKLCFPVEANSVEEHNEIGMRGEENCFSHSGLNHSEVSISLQAAS